MTLLKTTLNGLIERLKDNKKIYAQIEEGYLLQLSCDFREGATESQIVEFEQRTGWIIPDDYREFLMFSNGARILSDSSEDNGIHLLSLNEIEEATEPYYYEHEYYIIGFTQNGHLLIDSEVCEKGTKKINYLSWIESTSSEEDKLDLGSNFEIWLDRFVIAQGANFWEWQFYNAENYYNN